MDDDFGASVWATTPSDPIILSSPHEDVFPTFPTTNIPSEPSDDFDDFGAPAEPGGADGDEDDFGDFGDFEEAEEAGGEFTGAAGFSDGAGVAGPSTSRDWEALRLEPLPSRRDLEEQIDEILGPLWAHDDLSQALTDDDIREVGGLNQILITPESRALYKTLFPPTPPPAQPPNWTRSRIRRQHLIMLGIPVNLDEMLPQVGGRPMPALQITTRPMSAPPSARGAPQSDSRPSSLHPSRAGTPVPSPGRRGGAAAQLGLGPKPQLDERRIEELLALKSEQLSMLPLPAVEARLRELRTQTANTAALLTHLLQTRDALQQDSETYNKLIAELVGEAQKMKSHKGRAPSRRGSGMT
ncbi:hypothetical protein FA95DRAFT_1555865 [Auriscalpium vulgare]|uniref:Uncharacterized protein n=1 Tax=Auriscalpium vulgare TaxID=40419 RepID=A0ACB8S1E1_9AGAM|nr:hypothetical protein FA95DRAFT_1555865 [Auriscalpium vulgare]